MFRAMPSPRVVETVLRRHPCVWDAAVVGLTDGSGQQVMAAVVHLAQPLPDAVADLSGYCQRFLPAIAVPAQWVFTDGLRSEPASQPEPASQAGPTSRGQVRIPAQAHRAPHLDF